MSEHLRELAAGTIAGCTATLLEYPFDTVKVRLQQLSTNAAARRAPVAAPSYVSVIRTMLREEGVINGFYKGVPAALTASAVEHAVMFWAYRNATAWWQRWAYPQDGPVAQDTERLTSVMVGGAACGLVASFCLTPVELVKCRMQVENTLPAAQRQYRSAVHCAMATAQLGGIAEMYRGNVAMLIREIPGCTAYFLTFQLVGRALLVDGETVHTSALWKHLLAGGLAGVAFWTALYPADVVKTRMQTQVHATGAPPASFSRSFAQLFRKEGLRGMYRGWGITAARAFPANAVLLAVYQKVDATWESMSPSSRLHNPLAAFGSSAGCRPIEVV